MIVRELITKLGFKLDEASVNKGEKATQQMKKNADEAADAIRNMLAGFLAWSSVKSVIAIGDEMQSLRARIGMLPQTVGDSGEAFEFVARAASDARQSVDAYASFYIKAGEATQDFVKDQNELREIVDGVAFGLAASGSSAQSQKEAFFQLGQAIGSPVVQMEEMNTLIDVAPKLFRALGKAIPGANNNLKAFISTGKVTGKMLAEGLVKVLPQFRDEISKMPMSVGTATTLIANQWKVMIDRLNRESLFITRIANFILAGFDSIAAGVDWLGAKFNGFSNVVRFALIAATAAFVAWKSAFLIGAVQATIAMLPMIAAIGLVALVIDDLYTWMQGGESVIGDFVKWFNSGTEGANYLRMALAQIGIVALLVGGKMALAWVLAMGPLAGLIVALGAVMTMFLNIDKITAWVKDKWEKMKGFFGAGAEFTAVAAVSPAQAVGSPASGSKTVNANTTVNLTVPPGTSPTDTQFFSQAAQSAFGKVNQNLAGDLGVYAP